MHECTDELRPRCLPFYIHTKNEQVLISLELDDFISVSKEGQEVHQAHGHLHPSALYCVLGAKARRSDLHTEELL